MTSKISELSPGLKCLDLPDPRIEPGSPSLQADALPSEPPGKLTSPTSLVAQTVKCLPTIQETWVQSLGWEDLLEKEMATHSSILAFPLTPKKGAQRNMLYAFLKVMKNGDRELIY